MSLKLDHVAFAVRDISASIAHYQKTLGFSLLTRETLAERNIELAFLGLANTKIELLMGLNSDNPISKFIQKQGEGIHHVCYEVKDINAALLEQKKLGITPLDEVPRSGAHGTMIAFLHPKDFGGVLTELCQYL